MNVLRSLFLPQTPLPLSLDESSESLSICAASWNVAAINNNPFEFWVHCPDEQYNEFMNRVEDIMQTTDKDFNIIDIFTDERFNDLEEEMCRAGVEGSLAFGFQNTGAERQSADSSKTGISETSDSSPCRTE